MVRARSLWRLEREDGIDAMERYSNFTKTKTFDRKMANRLVDKYFGEDYGLDE